MNNSLDNKSVLIGIALIFILGAFLPIASSQLQYNVSSEIKNQTINDNSPLNQLRENLNPSPLNIVDPWWNPDWMYRKEININHSAVDANLTNFPVFVNISSDSDLSNSSKCQVDGDDIAFTDDNGNQLSHEIEFFNKSSGKLIAWVNVHSLLSTFDTSIYIYYGNSLATNQQDKFGVWDSNFTLVHHLNETSGIHYDSTIFNNNGTAQNGLNQSGIGIIDGADTFDANDDYIDCGNDSSLEPGINDFTFEAWIKRLSTGSNHCIVSKRASIGVGYIWWIQNNNVLRFTAKPGGTTINFAAGSITDSYWHHVAITLDRDNIASVYIDGDLISTRVISGATGPISSTKFLSIGREMQDGESGLTFDGNIDEVRISNFVRNGSWIKTEYNNQLNPSEFYDIALEEQQPTIPIVYSPFPPDNSEDVSVQLPKLSFNLSHKEGTLMDYSVETSPDIGSDNAIGVVNGTYNVSISGLTYETTYTWFVNVTDGYNNSNVTYDFITRNQFVPVFPSDFTSSAVATDQVDLGWSLGVNSDKTYIEWNSTSTWNLGDGTELYNGSGTGMSHSGLSPHTMYYYQGWGWNETDEVFSSAFAFDDAATWNSVPVVENPDPVNGSSGVDLSLTWSVSVSDDDGDSFDWSIECSNGDFNSSSGDSDGVKELDIVGLDNYTLYTVWVNVTDSIDNVNMTFYFTTSGFKFWNVELNFTETSGLKDNLIFGEASNASDGKDRYDVPKPSPPPKPYIYAWFDAGLSEPYNILWRDYRNYPDDFKVWNLSVLWAPTGDYSTNITISWNISDLSISEYSSIILENITNNISVNMLTFNNFTYNSSPLIAYDFQIICSSTPMEYDYNISLSAEWNLISLPVNQSFNKENITVNYLGVNYSWDEAVSNSVILDFIYNWDETNKKYEVTDVIDPGQGYWVYAYHECDLWISSIATENDLITDLFVEWNLVGSSHNTPVVKDNITVYYNGTEYTWQEAVNEYIILNFIYNWNEINKIYEVTDKLLPGRGYWIYAYYNCTLKCSEQ